MPPEDPNAKPAHDGLVFRLYDQAEDDWLGWLPQITIAPAADGTEPEAINTPARELPFP